MHSVDVSFQYIKNSFAQSDVIYTRGERLFFLGNYSLESETNGTYRYSFNGNHGDYVVTAILKDKDVLVNCSCPFPYKGCKHGVAALLDIKKKGWSGVRFLEG